MVKKWYTYCMLTLYTDCFGQFKQLFVVGTTEDIQLSSATDCTYGVCPESQFCSKSVYIFHACVDVFVCARVCEIVFKVDKTLLVSVSGHGAEIKLQGDGNQLIPSS